MPEELEFGGYKYIKVRLPEIEQLNREFRKLYGLFHSSSLHIDDEMYHEVLEIIDQSYFDNFYSIIANVFRVSEDGTCNLVDVDEDESSARYCYVLVVEDVRSSFNGDIHGYSPDVYVREDVKG